MQLLGFYIALLEVGFHQFFVDFDDLLDQRAVGVGDGREIRVARRVEKAIDHLFAVCGRQVDRQAFLAERGLDVGEQRRQVDVLRVDLVDDDEAAQPALARPLHHALRDHLDAVLRVDHDGRRLDRRQRVQRLAEEIRIAGRVDQVDVAIAVREINERARQRMLEFFFERVEVADRRAFIDAAGRGYRARLVQQSFGQCGFACRAVSDQSNRAYCLRCVLRHVLLSTGACGFLV